MSLVSNLKTMTQVLLLLQTGFVRTKETREVERENSMVKTTSERLLDYQSDVFVNEWAVRIPGGPLIADAVAEDLGYDNTGQVEKSVDISASVLRQLEIRKSTLAMLVYQNCTAFYLLSKPAFRKI